ncbi:hypothetical protein GALL_148610 [mine drainage metagenome]|uniref:Uncharacterized protein n=1 Tax=mine drainage metagenome TaxID=410659 RepID=A0A1J5S522_9ZZZZ
MPYLAAQGLAGFAAQDRVLRIRDGIMAVSFEGIKVRMLPLRVRICGLGWRLGARLKSPEKDDNRPTSPSAEHASSGAFADGFEDAAHQGERRRRAAADDRIDPEHVRYRAA